MNGSVRATGFNTREICVVIAQPSEYSGHSQSNTLTKWYIITVMGDDSLNGAVMASIDLKSDDAQFEV